ncbi:MAG: amino acid adenylation domain-containing protein, partial [Acetobacteraceae bacterium]|nr:amino acid adenylation domain-containing protein [Acetobacteraceae bacterium]
LAGAPERLELPTDFPRPAILQHRGGEIRFLLDAALVGRVQKLARSSDATLFMVLLATFTLLTQRASGQNDISVGIPIANRPDQRLERVVGLFLNTLVLRTRVEPCGTFRDLLAEVRRTALAAYGKGSVPFGALVERLQPQRSLSHNPLFQVMLNLVNTRNATIELEGLRVTQLGNPQGMLAKFDLSLSLATAPDGTLDGRLEYNAELFLPETAAFLAECFVTLLSEAVARPDAPLPDLSCLGARPAARVAAAERVPLPARPVEFGTVEQSIPQRFAEQVRRFGERIAVQAGVVALSYRQLAAAAYRVAGAVALAAHAPQIGLLLPHDERMCIGILGTLAAGRSYVALDPAHPEERLAFILDDVGADLILCSADLVELAGRLTGSGRTVLPLDQLMLDPATLPSAPAPDAVAYILYTSGSTGRPKGVVQSHRNVLHFIREYTEALRIGPDDRLLQLASYAFDAAVMDMFGALLNGATLCPISPRARTMGEIGAVIAAERITIIHATPTVFRQLLAEDWIAPASVRLVVLGGETVRREDVLAFRSRFGPECVLVNGYGPTESTVTLQHFVAAGTELPRASVPVGRPVGGTDVALVDERGNEADLFGEIVIRSPYVALGYWRQASSSTFSDDPTRPGRRRYRSGDLARLLPDGALEFVGRRDGQVKLRGVRIELGEIEAVLRSHAAVGEAAVIVCPAERGEDRLVAYVSGDSTAAELKAYLARKLPSYMVPSAIVPVPALPLTVGGKLDRRALPAPAPEVYGNRPPVSPAETVLAEIWSELLGAPVTDVDTHFFDAGGHSLMAMQVVARVRERLGVALGLREVFEHARLGELARVVEGSLRGAALPELRPLPAGAAPVLSFAQQRL